MEESTGRLISLFCLSRMVMELSNWTNSQVCHVLSMLVTYRNICSKTARRGKGLAQQATKTGHSVLLTLSLVNNGFSCLPGQRCQVSAQDIRPRLLT